MARPALKAGEHGDITVVAREDGFEARTRVRGLDGRVRQVARRGRTKGIAKARLLEALEAVITARPEKTSADYLDAWLDGRKRAGLAQQSLDAYAASVARLKQRFGGVEPARLTPAMLQSAVDSMPPGRAKNSLTALRGMVKAAAMDGALSTDPMLGVGLEARRRVEPPAALTVEQFKAFYAHVAAYAPRFNAADPEFMRILDWLAATGARTGEVLGIHAEHLTRESLLTPDGVTGRWVLTISGTVVQSTGRGVYFQPHTKAHDSRRIVIPDELMVGAPTSGPLFPSRNGRLRDPSSLRAQWRKRTAGSPWEWVTPKTIRKTVATALDRAEGRGSAAAARMLGHTDDAVTRRHYIMPELDVLDFTAELGVLGIR